MSLIENGSTGSKIVNLENSLRSFDLKRKNEAGVVKLFLIGRNKSSWHADGNDSKAGE